MLRALTVLVLALVVFVGSAPAQLSAPPPAFQAMPLFRGPGDYDGRGDLRNEGGGLVNIVLDLLDGTSAADARAWAARYRLTPVSVSPFTDQDAMFRASVPFTELDARLRELRSDGLVELAEGDLVHWALGFPNDPLYKNQWHLDQIRMPQAWPMADGAGVTVAVIDTGVGFEDYGRFRRAQDLAGTRFAKGYNFVDNNDHPIDDNGHGTHVAGTIAQTTNNGVGAAGIGLSTAIMPCKVLSAGGFGNAAAIAAAIRYAADHGAKVINMSLGSPLPSYVIKKACDYAHAKGVIIVCAAGNSGRRGVGYPARFDGCVGVSATRFDEQVTFYSSWGPGVDVAAPGGDTRVDQNGDGVPDGVIQNTFMNGDPDREGYYGFMGTSMAAPHVAGVAALIIGKGVTDPDKVEQILKKTARPKGSGPGDEKYGAGIIDAAAALRAVRGGAGSAGGPSLATLLLLLFAALLVAYMLTRMYPTPHAEWLAGAAAGAALLSSALVPVLSVLLLSGVRRLRPLAGGLCWGAAMGLAGSAFWSTWSLGEAAGTWTLGFAALNALLAFGAGAAVDVRERSERSSS